MATTLDLSNELSLRLEDAEQRVFPIEVKLKAFNVATLQVISIFDFGLLSEIQHVDSYLDASSGEIDLSDLTYSVLNGGEGIIGVLAAIPTATYNAYGYFIDTATTAFEDTDSCEWNKYTEGTDYNNYWAFEINPKHLKRLENDYFYPDDTLFYYVQSSKLKFLSNSLTGITVSIYYLRIPATLTISSTPMLQSYWDSLVLGMAETYCWYIEGRYDRAKAAKDIALREIGLLNRKYEEQQQLLDIGIYIDDWS